MIFLNKVSIIHIVTVSLFVKLLALYMMPSLDFPDSKTYLTAGYELFNGGQIEINNVMPIHPILAYLFKSSVLLKLLNIIFATVSVFLVYKLVLIIFLEKRYALFAAFISAFYPYFIFYSITGLTESLYIVLILSSFLLLYNKNFLLASIVIVLSILHRPTLDLLAPLLIFTFAFYVHKFNFKTSSLYVLKYLVVYVVLMSPWWYHQYNKYNQFVRLNLGDGIVWYSGNNPMNMSGGGVTGSTKGDDMDMSIFSHIQDPIEKNNAMKQAAFEFIKENPNRFIELAGIKFIRFWRLWPYAPEYEKPLYIVISILSYGMVLLFSIVFLVQYLKQYFRTISPILLLILYLTAVHMILIGSIRYRLPLEPFLIMFASVASLKIYQRFKGNPK